MRRLGKNSIWVLALVLGLFLLTCYLPGEALAAPKATGKLTIAFGAESNVLDVTKAAAGVDWYFNSQIYELPLMATPQMKRENCLAESWQLTTEGGKQVVEVKIRKGVKFHSGDTITAKDFVYSFERLKDPKISKWAHYQASVDRIEVINDYRFKIYFKEPDAEYITGLLRLYGISKAYFEKVGDDGVQKHPVGTGPWKFVSRKIGEELNLEAFDELSPSTARRRLVLLFPRKSWRRWSFSRPRARRFSPRT